ncbi:trypsin-like peptidase domain-containing protein [Roseomonas gilardii subsp. gilardii]|uniref:tetratricopeptide repeat-containing serine protease family protein n=1 Tax=Roseomonas gilardii TaxID=257708 RepID=UPI001FF94E2E|nr:trypsin-like peptidase domain-containing protein [Roseomonas gilardii]UPG71650.1 trypsin-like peptidase domain-containing protein [Roseomonas gilardii subsp. gilardii]
MLRCLLLLSSVALLGLADPAEAAAPDRLGNLTADALASGCHRPPSRLVARPRVAEATLRQQARDRDPEAMYSLAQILLESRDEDETAAEALYYLEQAALAGHLHAAAEAGSAHASGYGTERDEARAVAWWRYGASRGQLRAQGCLMVAALLGRGMEADPVEAARWAILRESQHRGPFVIQPGLAAFERQLSPESFTRARQWAARPVEVAPVPSLMPKPARSRPAKLAAGEEFAPDIGREESALPSRPAYRYAVAQTAAEDRIRKTGSGFAVAPHLIVTNWHVVNGCRQVSVQAGLAELAGAKLRGRNEELDLALVDVPGLNRPSLAIATDVRPGTPVAAMGFPGMNVKTREPTVTGGNVSAIGVGENDGWIQYTSPTQPGNSGGALLDMSGRVVGMPVGQADAILSLLRNGTLPQNVNLAIAPRLLRRFLRDYDLPLTEASAFADAASQPRNLADLMEETGRSVVRVLCYGDPPKAPRSRTARAATPSPTPVHPWQAPQPRTRMTSDEARRE